MSSSDRYGDHHHCPIPIVLLRSPVPHPAGGHNAQEDQGREQGDAHLPRPPLVLPKQTQHAVQLYCSVKFSKKIKEKDGVGNRVKRQFGGTDFEPCRGKSRSGGSKQPDQGDRESSTLLLV
jgi:hypothetical protein